MMKSLLHIDADAEMRTGFGKGHRLQRRVFCLIVLVGLVCLSVVAVPPAEAAKKKKGEGQDAAKIEAEIQKGLEPINKQLGELMVKIQSRMLFSPTDAGQLAEIKYQLLDLMLQYPKSPQLAKPIYQAGVLYTEREAFTDAFELFSFVAGNFPESPYGMKSRAHIQQLEKRLGENYFPKEPPKPELSEEKVSGDPKDKAKK